MGWMEVVDKKKTKNQQGTETDNVVRVFLGAQQKSDNTPQWSSQKKELKYIKSGEKPRTKIINELDWTKKPARIYIYIYLSLRFVVYSMHKT